jgi:signal transduction histidine kinase
MCAGVFSRKGCAGQPRGCVPPKEGVRTLTSWSAETGFSRLRRRAPPAWSWLVIALGALTVWILLDPRVSFSYHGPEARLITETAIAFVGAGVVALSLSRFINSGFLIDAAVGFAFLILALPNIGQGLILPVTRVDLFDWEDAGMYAWTVSRITAFLVLLISAAYFGDRAIPADRRWQVLARGLPLLLLGAATYTAFLVFRPQLPDLLTASGRTMLATGANVRGAFVEVTSLQIALQLTLTGVAALTCCLFLMMHVQEPPQGRFHRWVGMSLIFATFSQLHYAIYPSVYSPTITTGDMLRLAFYAVLMGAVGAEYLRYQTLMRELTALEERTRIARDVHDGAAQSLSFILASLAQTLQEGVPAALGQRLTRWREVLGDAQESLRDAVSALGPPSSSQDLRQRLSLFCQGFSRRYGMEINFRCVGSPGALPPPKDRELLFLLAEALHNVRKHAATGEATVVLEGPPRCLILTVSDNGVGLPFPGQEPAQGADSTGYGYASMTERAGRLGGSLLITSEVQKGTTVQLTIPR